MAALFNAVPNRPQDEASIVKQGSLDGQFPCSNRVLLDNDHMAKGFANVLWHIGDARKPLLNILNSRFTSGLSERRLTYELGPTACSMSNTAVLKAA